jgi:DtxR family Mn-dependent transcriptional regulator
MKTNQLKMEEDKIDEFLELVWTLKEKGKSLDIATELGTKINEIEKKGFVKVRKGKIELTDKGEKRAKKIVRRHRLAEMLLYEVFELEKERIHPEACKFEHVLSPEVTDSVCTFLGHPPMCPHDNPIPRGECCYKFKKEVKPLVIPLREMQPGEEGRIVFIAPREHTRLDRLSALGVIPGSILKLHQKQPSFVIKIGETELAIEEDIANDIYVKKWK